MPQNYFINKLYKYTQDSTLIRKENTQHTHTHPGISEEIRDWKHISDTSHENSLVIFKSPTSHWAMSYIRKALRDQNTGWMRSSPWTPHWFGGWGRGSNHVLCIVSLTASIKGHFTAHSERSTYVTGHYRTKEAHLMFNSSSECYTVILNTHVLSHREIP